MNAYECNAYMNGYKSHLNNALFFLNKLVFFNFLKS